MFFPMTEDAMPQTVDRKCALVVYEVGSVLRRAVVGSL
jgi:hypothetical protein